MNLAYPLLFVLLMPQQKKADPPDPPAIILPDEPKPPVPPKPDPAVPAKLGSDATYIVRANVEATVLTSPAGILKVTKDVGPIRIRTIFYGGDGTRETRNFTEKYIYSVETLSKGTAELIVIPPGAAEKDIIRRQIEALDGPIPPKPPDPPQPTDPLTKALQAAYDAETNKDKAAMLKWLVSCYKAIAGNGDGSANDPNLKTYGDLFNLVKPLIESKVPKGAIPLVEKVIGTDVDAVLKPTKQTPIDRASATKEFATIAAALQGVKP